MQVTVIYDCFLDLLVDFFNFLNNFMCCCLSIIAACLAGKELYQGYVDDSGLT